MFNLTKADHFPDEAQVSLLFNFDGFLRSGPVLPRARSEATCGQAARPALSHPALPADGSTTGSTR